MAPLGEPQSVAAHRYRDRAAPAGRDQAARSSSRICTAMMQLAEVLDLARWAPSGDNTQPWRFALETADRVAVFGHDTRTHCVYDLDGHPSQISLGALLETMVLAGTRFGLAAQIDRRKGSPDDKPVFDVRFHREAGIAEDPLVSHIQERRVQRRPLRVRNLTQREKQVLEDAVKPGFQICWWEGWKGRAKFARLNFSNAKIRLTLPEAYRVHRDAIEWGARFSEDRVPGGALGASTATLTLMRWAMARWERIALLNRYLAGCLAPRVFLRAVRDRACVSGRVPLRLNRRRRSAPPSIGSLGPMSPYARCSWGASAPGNQHRRARF